MQIKRRLALITALSLPATLLVGAESSAAPAYPVVARVARLDPGAASEGKVLRAPLPFTMVGISFRGEAPEFKVRVRGERGWSRWAHLDADPTEGPDPGSPEHTARRSTLPLWTGPARELELRLEYAGAPSPRDLRVHFIDATGRALGAPGRFAARFRSGWGPAPALAIGKPGIVSRPEWGADETLRRCGPDYASGVKGAFVHHTAGSNTYMQADSPAIVRSIYWYHTQVNGWCDIGYNFLVDRFGATFEGRFGGVERPVIGAHAGGFNTGSTGVALMGNFVDADPPAAGIDAAVRLLSWKFAVHRLFPRGLVSYTSGGNSKYPEGTIVTLPTIAGHRDVSDTACPARLYNALPAIRSRVVVPHPDGALIKGSDSAVYLVEEEQRRIVVSAGAFESRFRWKEVVRVTDEALTFYPEGAPLGYRDGSLIKTPDGTVWAISKGERRGFTSMTVFDGLGYSTSNVHEATWAEAEVHVEGLPVANPAGPHLDGTLVRGADPTVYLVEDSHKLPVPSASVFESRFRWSEIVRASESELAAYLEGSPLGYRDGSLIATPDGTVWVISIARRLGFTSADVFLGMGYSFANVLPVSWGEALLTPEGPPL